jgi:hypothetical protein
LSFRVSFKLLQSKYKNLPTSASVASALVLYFCNLFYFSVAITALSANIAVGSGRILLSFLYIRQFGVWVMVECRGSRVIGRGSQVEGHRSRVKSRGRGSKVEGQKSRVKSRKSKILNFYPF